MKNVKIKSVIKKIMLDYGLWPVAVLLFITPFCILNGRLRDRKIMNEGINVEAVVVSSELVSNRWFHGRKMKIYFHLNGKYEEYFLDIYPQFYSPATIPEIKTGDTIIVRTIPGKPDYTQYVSKHVNKGH